jgi:hypothetical protein
MSKLLQIPALVLIYMIISIHSKRFEANKSIGPWWHLWWGFVYGVPTGIAAYLCHSYALAWVFALERFVLYNPMLNLMRNESFFYIVAKNSKPGFWDKIEVSWKGFYPYIWGLGFLGYIIIQFFA